MYLRTRIRRSDISLRVDRWRQGLDAEWTLKVAGYRSVGTTPPNPARMGMGDGVGNVLVCVCGVGGGVGVCGLHQNSFICRLLLLGVRSYIAIPAPMKEDFFSSLSSRRAWLSAEWQLYAYVVVPLSAKTGETKDSNFG